MISGGDNPYDIHDAKLSSSATAHESSSVTAHEISNIHHTEVSMDLRARIEEFIDNNCKFKIEEARVDLFVFPIL